MHRGLSLEEWRQHLQSQILSVDGLKPSKVFVEKITQFSLLPLEFLKISNKVVDYYQFSCIKI